MGEFIVALARIAGRLILVFAGVTAAFALYSCTRGGPPRRPPDSPATIPLLTSPPIIGVRLSAGTDASQVVLSVAGPYEFRRHDTGEVLSRGESLPASGLTAREGACLIGTTPLRGGDVDCVPGKDGTLRVGETAYRGSLRCIAIGNRITVVNRLDLEQYLAGVLGSEAPLDWPDASLEAQCVAARSYALWQMRSARSRGADQADLTDDVSSQVYLGMRNETDRSRAIVAATRGAVCVFNGGLFPTFYSNTCGGHTEPAFLVLPNDRPPDIAPLMGRPCEFCELSPRYSWSESFPRKEIASRLGAGGLSADEVTQVRILEKAPGGHAVKIGVATRKQSTERVMTGLEFRLALGARKLMSTKFEVAPAGDSIRFTGNGWGHAAGMCQMGAFRMGKSGFDSLAILKYYYPGAEVVRLYE
ncbi:MAG: SpoIID/LytB domain-containing protein [Planctomycetes bacterium]|nr:SpoIID/LytB domain-containing protein [Planctomycetota bacterium]